MRYSQQQSQTGQSNTFGCRPPKQQLNVTPPTSTFFASFTSTTMEQMPARGTRQYNHDRYYTRNSLYDNNHKELHRTSLGSRSPMETSEAILQWQTFGKREAEARQEKRDYKKTVEEINTLVRDSNRREPRRTSLGSKSSAEISEAVLQWQTFGKREAEKKQEKEDCKKIMEKTSDSVSAESNSNSVNKDNEQKRVQCPEEARTIISENNHDTSSSKIEEVENKAGTNLLAEFTERGRKCGIRITFNTSVEANREIKVANGEDNLSDFNNDLHSHRKNKESIHNVISKASPPPPTYSSPPTFHNHNLETNLVASGTHHHSTNNTPPASNIAAWKNFSDDNAQHTRDLNPQYRLAQAILGSLGSNIPKNCEGQILDADDDEPFDPKIYGSLASMHAPKDLGEPKDADGEVFDPKIYGSLASMHAPKDLERRPAQSTLTLAASINSVNYLQDFEFRSPSTSPKPSSNSRLSNSRTPFSARRAASRKAQSEDEDDDLIVDSDTINTSTAISIDASQHLRTPSQRDELPTRRNPSNSQGRSTRPWLTSHTNEVLPQRR